MPHVRFLDLLMRRRCEYERKSLIEHGVTELVAAARRRDRAQGAPLLSPLAHTVQ